MDNKKIIEHLEYMNKQLTEFMFDLTEIKIEIEKLGNLKKELAQAKDELKIIKEGLAGETEVFDLVEKDVGDIHERINDNSNYTDDEFKRIYSRVDEIYEYLNERIDRQDDSLGNTYNEMYKWQKDVHERIDWTEENVDKLWKKKASR